jgi:hypothetical protein
LPPPPEDDPSGEPAEGGPSTAEGATPAASAQAGVDLSHLPAGSGPAASAAAAQAGPGGSAPGGSGQGGSAPAPAPADPAVNGVRSFLVEVDGRPLRLTPGETLTVRKGAKVKLVEIDGRLPSSAVMNLRGFVGRPGDATGHDQGTVCDTAKDLIPRFALTRDGATVFQLGAEDGPKLLAAAYLEIVSPKLSSVTLASGGVERTLKLGQRWNLPPGAAVTVLSVALAGDLPLDAPRYTLGGRSFPSKLPQSLIMPEIAVSLAVFSHGELAGKVVLAPAPAN